MLEKKTILSQIECTSTGVIGIRLKKVIMDGDLEISSEYHRTTLAPGGSLDAQIAAVNDNLKNAYGYPAIAVATVERIRRIVAVEHTADVISEYARLAQVVDAK